MLSFPRIVAFIAIILALSLPGCTKVTEKGTVSGKVTLEGKALAFGSVVFMGVDKTPRTGAIQKDGSYTVDEVPFGEVKISVSSPEPSSANPFAELPPDVKLPPGKKMPQRAKIDSSGWFPIPDDYGDFNKTDLSLVVKQKDTTYDIEMKMKD